MGNILSSREEWRAEDLTSALEQVNFDRQSSNTALGSSGGSSSLASSATNPPLSSTALPVLAARAAEWQRQEAAWFADSEKQLSIDSSDYNLEKVRHSGSNFDRNRSCSGSSSGSACACKSESKGGSIPAASTGIALTSASLALPAVPTHDPFYASKHGILASTHGYLNNLCYYFTACAHPHSSHLPVCASIRFLFELILQSQCLLCVLC